MTTALILITVALIAVHITACAKKMRSLKVWTKPFLVPMMGLTWFSVLASEGLTLPLWPAVLAGLAFYTLGDIFLIPRDNRGLFLAGMIMFTLGHVSFTWIFTRGGIAGIPLFVWGVLWAAAYIFLLNPRLDWTEKDTKYKAAYGAIVMLFGIAVGGSVFDGDMWAHTAAVIGVMALAFSDGMIIREMNRKTDMSATVMITYISAVALLLTAAFRLAA